MFTKERWRLVDLLTCTQASGLDAGTANSTPANLASPQSVRRPSGITSNAAADVKRSLQARCSLFKSKVLAPKPPLHWSSAPFVNTECRLLGQRCQLKRRGKSALPMNHRASNTTKMRATFHWFHGNSSTLAKEFRVELLWYFQTFGPSLHQ